MTVNLYTFVSMYSHVLDTADSLLDKGVAHVAGTGVSEAEMLNWRLIGDMHPLSFQFAVVCNFARQWPARAAGLEPPENIPFDLDVKGLKAAIADAKSYLAALKPEQFAGRDDDPMTVTLMPDVAPTLPVERWISVFATTNIYFHITTAYAILRSRGVVLGKRDMFAAGF